MAAELPSNMNIGVSHMAAVYDTAVSNISRVLYAIAQNSYSVGIGIKLMVQNQYKQTGDNGAYSMDVDLGARISPWPWLHGYGCFYNIFGLNFMEDAEDTLFNSRGISTGLGLTLSPKLFPFSVCINAGINSKQLHDFVNEHGIEIWTVPVFRFKSPIHCLAGFVLEKDSTSYRKGFNIGMGKVFEYGARYYRLDYLVQMPGEKTGSKFSDITNQISVSMVWGGRSDIIKPFCSVEADKERFTPEGDNKEDNVLFKIQAGDNEGGSGLKKWCLMICNKEKDGGLKIRKSFSGTGMPPSVILWEGRDNKHVLLNDGAYYFRLTCVDHAHNYFNSPWQILFIGGSE
ncbi:MAG: hypothetical protein ABIA63_00425 [bacterium]